MYVIKPKTGVKKEIIIPSDKSISHRAAIISSLAPGKTKITPFLASDDTQATLACLKKCGVGVVLNKNSLNVEGQGKFLPAQGKINLYAHESGTTIRLLSGILCGQKCAYCFDAADSLRQRPMHRITYPLRLMGADIKGKKEKTEEYPPLLINPVKAGLRHIKYKLPVASAQVKSAIIFASLYASGVSEITEPYPCRDHTERMLALFGARRQKRGKIIFSPGVKNMVSPGTIFIPADFSSAAFFIVLGLILKDTQVMIKNVNINPTRCGLLTVLTRMGADIKVINKKDDYEPYADILVTSSHLKAAQVKEEEIPLMIDEIPILCVAASCARGQTCIYGAGELKLKETDRINSLVYNLRKTGVQIFPQNYSARGKKNWMIKIEGRKEFKPARFKSFADHRTAMSLIVLGKAMEKESKIDNIKCINKSFPEFISTIESL